MTNKEKWLSYTSGLSSPQNYIDWSWRFVIAAALQRRVWFGSDHMPLFPNMYTILVGEAGIGKGIVISPAMEMLKYHKKKDFTTINNNSSDQEKVIINATEKANLEDAEASLIKLKRGGERIDAPLFPYAPDATTYEALVESMSNSGRRINYTTKDENGMAKMGIYYHCSMYFSLPELGSLFRKRTDDVVNYLLGLYDCPLDYEYKTKTKGEDRVRRGCLNILAGTTPSFMETVFNENLIDQGFSSRAFFIFANKNRKHVAFPEPLTPEQIQCRTDLLIHVKKLAALYGRVEVEPSTKEWLQKWWVDEQEGRHPMSNASPRLKPYRARKQIHLVKVAMAEHFGETTDMFMPLSRFEQAAEILHEEEKNMHLALTFEGDNPLGKVTDKILEYIRTVRAPTIVDLTTTFWKQLPNGKKSLDEILVYLIGAGDIESVEEQDENTQRTIIKYKAI